MKKILLIAVVAGLASCQKKHCWKCNPNPNGNATGFTYTTEVKCGMTQKEINKFMSENTHDDYNGWSVNWVCGEKI